MNGKVSDYRHIYNVWEHTTEDTAVKTPTQTQAQELCDWINNDEYLSTLFYAFVNEYYSGYYLFRLASRKMYEITRDETICPGIAFGRYSASSSGHSGIISLYGNAAGSSKSATNNSSGVYLYQLKLAVIETDYGFTASLYNYQENVPYYRFIHADGTDEDGNTVPCDIIVPSTSTVYISDGQPSTYARECATITATSTSVYNQRINSIISKFYPNNTTVFFDNVRWLRGQGFENGAFFTGGGGTTWISLTSGSTDLEGLCLRAE